MGDTRQREKGQGNGGGALCGLRKSFLGTLAPAVVPVLVGRIAVLCARSPRAAVARDASERGAVRVQRRLQGR